MRRNGHLLIRHPVLPLSIDFSQLFRAHIVENLFFRSNVNTPRALTLAFRPIRWLPGIIPGPMATVGNEEALVDPYKDVEIDDQNLNGEVENVEASFVLIIGRMVSWSFPTSKVGRDTKRGTGAEKDGGQDENGNLMSEPPAAKFLQTGLARDDEPADDEQDREEGHDGVESTAVELDVVIDAPRVQIQGIGTLNDGCDDSEEGEYNEDVQSEEGEVKNGMPAGVGMRGANDALGKEYVDDEEENHPGGHKDIGGNGQPRVVRVGRPCDAQDHGDDPRHAETEHHARYYKAVSFAHVDFKDGHVGNGANDEKDEEDGADWDVDADCRETTQGSGSGRIGRTHGHAHGGSL